MEQHNQYLRQKNRRQIKFHFENGNQSINQAVTLVKLIIGLYLANYQLIDRPFNMSFLNLVMSERFWIKLWAQSFGNLTEAKDGAHNHWMDHVGNSRCKNCCSLDCAGLKAKRSSTAIIATLGAWGCRKCLHLICPVWPHSSALV